MIDPEIIDDIYGEKMVMLPSDGRYVCEKALTEMVNYGFFTSIDGEYIAIPVWAERPPLVICGRDGFKECCGRGCEHFINRFEGMEVEDDEQ